MDELLAWLLEGLGIRSEEGSVALGHAARRARATAHEQLTEESDMETIDLRKQMKELWSPPVGRVVLVTVSATHRRPNGSQRVVRGVTVQFRRVRGVQAMCWKRRRLTPLHTSPTRA